MKIRYENTIDDVLAFARYHAAHSPTHRWTLVLLRWCLPVVLLAVMPLMVRLGDWPMVVIWCVGPVLLMLGSGWLLDWANAFTNRALYREGSNRGTLCPHELELAPPNLIERSPVGEQSLLLAAIEKVASTPTHTFIMTAPMTGHVIPRAAVSEGDYEAFVRAVAEEVEKAKERTPT